MGRRYYSYGPIGSYVEEIRRGWFSKIQKRRYVPFLFYEENGKYYEIFTGKYLGICSAPEGLGGKNRIISVPESTITIPLYLCGPCESQEAKELTAVEFSELVKKHIPLTPIEKDTIDTYFRKGHEAWLAINNKTTRANIETEAAEEWISEFIKKHD